jgi:para-nitrobenzyl esterase
MMASLATFARDGDPNNARLGVDWPAWPKVLTFDASPTASQIGVQ